MQPLIRRKARPESEAAPVLVARAQSARMSELSPLRWRKHAQPVHRMSAAVRETGARKPQLMHRLPQQVLQSAYGSAVHGRRLRLSEASATMRRRWRPACRRAAVARETEAQGLQTTCRMRRQAWRLNEKSRLKQ